MFSSLLHMVAEDPGLQARSKHDACADDGRPSEGVYSTKNRKTIIRFIILGVLRCQWTGQAGALTFGVYGMRGRCAHRGCQAEWCYMMLVLNARQHSTIYPLHAGWVQGT